jgi:hypothetical protein
MVGRADSGSLLPGYGSVVRLPAVGQYNFADAFTFLQRHVPTAVFKLASDRWDGGQSV